MWLLDSSEPKQALEVTYLSQGFGWAADYVLTVGDEATASAISTADLTGWVTLQNNTSTSYENAQLKLVAGNVQRVNGMPMSMAKSEMKDDGERERQFSEESFFEYHLYTLDHPTTLLSNEQKQVTLLEGHGIQVLRRELIFFFGASYYYRGSYGQVVSNQKVGVFLEIKNDEANHLGMPLPKGTVRVYKADKSGAEQFIGEDSIDHTPRDEKVRIKMGESFDVVGDRKQARLQTRSRRASTKRLGRFLSPQPQRRRRRSLGERAHRRRLANLVVVDAFRKKGRSHVLVPSQSSGSR